MAKGKFSQPRPYRDEEREIEAAFRQMTGKAPAPEPQPQPEPQDYVPMDLPELESEASEEDFTGLYESEEYPEEPDTIDKIQAFFRKAGAFCGENKKLVLVALCALALVTIVGFMAAFFIGTSDPYDGKILDNVYIAGVNVGGMTKSEAVAAVNAAVLYGREDMVVDIAGTTLTLKPSDTKVSLDAKAAVNAAYSYGRTGSRESQEQIALSAPSTDHFIGLLPYLTMDQARIRKVLTDYAQDIGSTLTQPAYGLEGDRPELATDKFDESAPTQTLVIITGTPGVGFDAERVFNQILDAYSLHQFRVEVGEIDPVAEPDPVDLEKIHQEFHIEPVNATVNMQTFKPIPGSYGYTFDLEAAQALLDKAGYGEEIRIPMEYIEPEIMGEDVFFRDVLGSCETPHNSNENRNANLVLACRALDGLVLNPGQEFDYNATLGERTAEKGYKPAPSYSGLETVDTIGGGICQVSSTLYYSVLLADLDVTQRQNHGFVPSYIDYGMDATVSWGGPNFKFVNSTNYPIKLRAEVSDGKVRIQILGTDEKDYYVKMTYKITAIYEPETEYEDYPYDNPQGYKNGDVIKNGTTGYYVKSYKQKYDKQTNALLSTDFEANSSYVTVNKVVARVEDAPTEPPVTDPPVTAPPVTEPPVTEPPATDPPVTEPPAPPTEAPTQPPTEAPTEAPPPEEPQDGGPTE